MPKSAQKISASTQQFIEIEDIVDEIVILRGNVACVVVEVTASNFALLSKRDQDTKIYSYAAFLNSLNFPIQILIRNKRVDVSSYLKILEEEERKTTNQMLARHIHLYREFVSEMVSINVVLSKTFYVIMSYTSLEGGVANAVPATKGISGKQIFVANAKKALGMKAEAVHGQLRRFALSTKTLDKKELVKLFYDIFNEISGEFDFANTDENFKSVFIKPAPPGQ